MEVKVNREVTLWVQDTYEVPEGTTREEVEKLVLNDEIYDFFEERDMFANIEAGGDTDETGNIEIL